MCVGDFSVIKPFSIVGINSRQGEFSIRYNPSLEVRSAGVLISTSIVAAGSRWLFPKLGFDGFSISEYLSIGTIFSSTDSVCTLQVLSQDETPLQFVICWDGLMRGAVSVALAVGIQAVYSLWCDTGSNECYDDHHHYCDCALSTIVFGFLTKPLVDCLLPSTNSSNNSWDPRDPVSPKEDMTLPLLSLEESASENLSRAKENVSMLMDRPVYTLHSYWRRFDHTYMRPVFGGPCTDESSSC